jgi:nucleoside-diphosphate-sugar epimerase
VLLEAGYRVRLFDVRAPDEALRSLIPDLDGGAPNDIPLGAEVVVGDLRRSQDVEAAMPGVTGVLHTAAWHGMHLREHPEQDFWDLNVEGTYNVYRAAARSGVKAVVFSSSTGAYGSSRAAKEGGPAVRTDETLPLRPTDIYGLSKVLGENMSLGYESWAGIAGASLRYGMFVPQPLDHRGIRFLYGGIEPVDVARANLVTMERLLQSGSHLGAFNIVSELPFDEADGVLLRTDPLAAIARHWPDGPALLAAAGVAPWSGIHELTIVDRAREVLGFRPSFGFSDYLDVLRGNRAPPGMATATSPRGVGG